MKAFLACLGGLALLTAGCGGNVVFAEDGDGSGGSTSPSIPNTTSSPNVTSGPSTSTGTQSPCETLCASVPGCFDQPGSCISDCEQSYVPGCESQTDALLICFAKYLTPDCNLGPGLCDDQLSAYNACSNQGCFTEECSNDDGSSCSCTGSCNGEQVEADCKPDMNGQVTCDCYFNGNYSGSCIQGAAISCTIETSCCVLDAPGGE